MTVNYEGVGGVSLAAFTMIVVAIIEKFGVSIPDSVGLAVAWIAGVVGVLGWIYSPLPDTNYGRGRYWGFSNPDSEVEE